MFVTFKKKKGSALAAAWSQRKDSIPAVLYNAALAAAMVMMRQTIRQTLENQNPPYLNRDTGTLIRSVTASPFAMKGAGKYSAIGRFGSNLSYAKLHEFGYSDSVSVKAHEKRITKAFGKTISPKKVLVRAHLRHVEYKARRMFGDTMGAHGQTVSEKALAYALHVLLTSPDARIPEASEILKKAKP